MGSGAMKNNFFPDAVVEHYPIPLYMAIGNAFKIPVQNMFPAADRQRIAPDNKRNNFINCIHVSMAFFHNLEIFFKLIGKCEIEHWLNAQIFPRFLKGMIPLCGDLPPQHGFPLRNGGQGFGIEGRIFGANGAFPVYTNFSGDRGVFCFTHGYSYA
jgi:hypothetical protein